MLPSLLQCQTFFSWKSLETLLCDLVGILTAFYLLLSSQISYQIVLRLQTTQTIISQAIVQLDTHTHYNEHPCATLRLFPPL